MLPSDTTAPYMYCYQMTFTDCVHVLLYHRLNIYYMAQYQVWLTCTLLPCGISNSVYVLYSVQSVSLIPQG